MTAQGSPLTRYRRALDRRHIFGAEIAARETGHLPLAEALGLVALYADEDCPKFEPAAVRWLARLALEKLGLTLRDLQPAAAALDALPTEQPQQRPFSLNSADSEITGHRPLVDGRSRRNNVVAIAITTEKRVTAVVMTTYGTMRSSGRAG